MLQIYVEGVPVPQGSKKNGLNRATGRPILIDDNGPALKPWRAKVSSYARIVALSTGVRDVAGPVMVSLRFVMPRPKYHFRTGRFAGELRADAPHFHTVTPDSDKLTRAILDALTVARVYGDDSQVCTLRVEKVYAGQDEKPGVRVGVFPLGVTA